MMRRFQRRFLFTGQLFLKTGLHIGGGRGTLSPSKAPVVRTPDNRPFVPGSSFKGAFRSTVEKLAGALPSDQIKTCALTDGTGCPGAPGSDQEDFNRRRREEGWNEDKLLAELGEVLCHTCWLFGSPFTASKINFGDLYLSENDAGMVQIRDGVAIDRDSEKQRPGLLYDYEVVAPTSTFELEIVLEDPTDIDLGLTCLGLTEFVSGFGYIGGNRSRGLGNCQINGLRVHALDLTVDSLDERAERLRRYLLGRTPSEKMTPVEDVDQFLQDKIEILLA